MGTGTFEYRNEAERRTIERAIAFVAEMNDLALSAPVGRVVDVCEGQALPGGRDLLRDMLTEAVQVRVDALEEKKGRRGSARAGTRSAVNGGVPAN